MAESGGKERAREMSRARDAELSEIPGQKYPSWPDSASVD